MRFDYSALSSIRDDSIHFNSSFSCPKVWNAYALVRQEDVVKLSSPTERDAMTAGTMPIRISITRMRKRRLLKNRNRLFLPRCYAWK